MATTNRIRTLNFLPEIFKTPTNSQFLSATLDQIVDQPNTKKIEGYIGSKFGYGINAKDKYVVEPNKTRTDYQLDPGVVFLKKDTGVANDFISYPGILDALKLEGGIVNNNDRLFNSEFYSWDSFTSLDKIINFNQYYWLPEGPPPVTISTDIVFNASDYVVTSAPNGYTITADGQTQGVTNPTLTLLRGGTYRFSVNQDSQFWIQGAPGVTGYDPVQTNVQTRDVYGVTNNGAEVGIVTFTVPSKDALDDYNFPGNNTVDVISTLPYDQVNGVLLSELGNIDGITSLEGLTVMFYNTGVVNELGYVSAFYDTTLYDEDGGTSYTFPGTSADEINYEGGYYTDVSATFYTITYEGSTSDPVIRLVPSGNIPTNEKITALYGTQWINRNFYRNTLGVINLIPYNSAILDVLYYQDGTSGNKVGQLRIIDSNTTNRINILTDILGKTNYTAPNGVVFTNGLKVVFQGDIYPTSYENVQYYVEGVGSAIELVAVSELIAPEPFTSSTYIPYDTLPYDIGNYDSNLYIPVTPDYITIARNSINKNAWSRSNRWFHVDVINATATYNNNPNIATEYATKENKAKRPIIEFYPNLKLFDSGVVGKAPIDFIDFRTSDAFEYVSGQQNYYPDVEVYTDYVATINSAVAATTTTITIDATKIYSVNSENKVITGQFQIGQYINDSTNILPTNTQITDISTSSGITTLTVEWLGNYTLSSTTIASLIANDGQNDNYALFEGARVVFASDLDDEVKNKIYIARFSTITPGSIPILTLTEADDAIVLPLEQTVAFRGYNYKGKDFYFDGLDWAEAQQKTTVNQPPLFDVLDSNGTSFGDSDVYVGTNFNGCKLFAYGLGAGIDDPILAFPLRYSSVNNVGDISFDVSLNLDTFDYVQGSSPITQKVNTGYVYNYSDLNTYVRQLGWQTAVSQSVQYQIFSFDYYALNPTTTFTCDVAKLSSDATEWPTIQVYVNNVLQNSDSYTTTTTSNTTVVEFTVPDPELDTIIQITLLSDQVSSKAYYSIPINLNNNPLNQDIEVANIGDIRGQYQSIFYNHPDTSGDVFGSNNYRDLGNMVPWGNRIIQNSASLVLPSAFLRKQNHNLFNALLFNSKEYINFKTLLVSTINSTDYNRYQTPSFMLDDALDQMSASKTDSDSFFWSDMLPSKASYITNSYSFANSLDVSIYPLSRVYNYTSANYYGVLVYLTRTVDGITTITQLIRGVDYNVSATEPSLTVETDLLPDDQITIKEYNQTYGSYCPNTPTKLGLYPASIPQVILDTHYSQPTYFILGHDGSYNKLYGNYVDGKLIDFRDQVLLEFEKRVYNNLKLGAEIPIKEADLVPGFWRDTNYTLDEYIQMYSTNFLNWVGQNRVNFKTQFYQSNNEWSYNYNRSGNKVNKQAIPQGYWRGIYQYFYDTSIPSDAPWQMLGFKDQPTWWQTRYGAAPYTSDNLVLWTDLAEGRVWNNGDPYIDPLYIRPELLQVLPVNSNGVLQSPFVAVMGNYINQNFIRDWKVGDVGPTEFSYRRSSTYPFDLMKLFALAMPAKFFNLGVDLDNYKYNTEFNQYLVNDRSHLNIANIQIYGNGTAKTSYINWIVDYEKQVGVDATTNITDLLDNIDVRLIYRLAGFSDKNLLKFYVEKGTPNSTNASLLIPDESFQVLLYDNQPFERIIYSGIVVQVTDQGTYKVYGNSQTNAYFTISVPKINGNYSTVRVQDLTVQLPNDFSDKTTAIPYGTEFYSVQEVASFIAGYGYYLQTQGVLFDQIESGLKVSWEQMVAEYLYWAQSGWEGGSIVNINPAANLLTINKDSNIVQPLTIHQQNFVLNQNLYPIQSVDLNIIRDGTLFSAKPLNQGDTVAYGQFNISNFEHGIVFNNVTLFDDVIYNLITGLRQNRIVLRGTKTAEWNGTIDAQGFILNQDNILEWNTQTKYTTGSIVKYKNKYWIAIKIIQASEVFNERDWKETDYNEIQKGLLPNSSTRSYESTLYYDVNKANLEQDADLLSFSLIGYRPRDYLALVDLTDITQINVYKNMLKTKGTRNATDAFKGANLPQGGIDYEIYENWAIKSGEYGGVLNNNFVEFRLNQNELTGNPSIAGLSNGVYTTGVQQEVPLYSIFSYGTPITNPNVLQTLPTETPNVLFPSAGYANFDDVKTSSYFYFGLGLSEVPLSKLYQGDYVWIANLQGTWQILSPLSIGQVINARNLNNGTVAITFKQPHGLTQYQPFAIANFDSNINGYFIANQIINTTTVLINLNLNPSYNNITGEGTAFKFESHRFTQPSDVINLPMLPNEFTKNKAWVDVATDGGWAVYRKSLNYQYNKEIIKANSLSFGSAVAFTNNVGYVVGDGELGEVYRYTYNPLLETYELQDTITGQPSFGTTISYSNDLFVISQPNGASASDRTVNIYQLVVNELLDELQLIQDPIQAPSNDITNWGNATAISGDQNWLFISDTDNNRVYVYRKSQTTNIFEQCTIITVDGVSLGDNFGYSLSTDYYGETLVVGCPDQNYDSNTDNSGKSYIFDRILQNFEAQSNSIPFVPQTYNLVSSPTVRVINATATNATNNRITLDNTTGLSVGTPLVIGNPIGGLAENTVYYVRDIPTATTVTVSLNKYTTQATLSVAADNAVIVNDTTNFEIGGLVIFYGDTGSSGLTSGTSYTITNVTTVTIDGLDYPALVTSATVSDSQINATAFTFDDEFVLATAASITMVVYAQIQPLYVIQNGTIISDKLYSVINNTFYMYGNVTAGDILTISTSNFVLMSALSATTPRVGAQFGQSVASNRYGTELLIGAPFETGANPQTAANLNEGSVYRYTNGGSKFGMIIGVNDCIINTSTTILLNGYAVTLPIGYAVDAANAINSAKITNVIASDSDGKLLISLRDISLATVNNKLNLSVLNTNDWASLGITPYTSTQVIYCPHEGGRTEFGTVIKFNEYGSFVASAPAGTRFVGTTFDATDDENFDNDTIFDNNTTQWVDPYINAGAVYMFDYLENYNETLLNIGKFVYAQSTNDLNETYGNQPYYGQALDFNNYTVMVGSPNFRPTEVDGQVVVYTNSLNEQDWVVYRNSNDVVDTSKIETAQLFSAQTNNTLENLDYIDPLQGKLLGVVRQNIDVVSNIDPAGYNGIQNTGSVVWGPKQVGQIWFDTTNTRFVNYHQNDVVYNSKWWGRVFPGSDVAIYSWISSNVTPSNYVGPGTPYDIEKYAVDYVLDNRGVLNPVYYYWVKNTNIIFTKTGKTLSDTIISSYIAAPKESGISYFSPIQSNVFAFYNINDYLNGTDTVFHIGFSTGVNEDPTHNIYNLIRTNYADDFLPGVPATINSTGYGNAVLVDGGSPEGLYDRLLDSLSGVDETGAIVPDPYLPRAVQYGILARPRQSFFVNRFGALKNYLTYANEILSQYPITEIRRSGFLFKEGTINPSTGQPFYITSNYWSYINWWAPGYDDNTKSALQVPLYADLLTLNVASGTIVTVEQNGDGKSETYIYNGISWTRIGLSDGTIQFSSSLWDYEEARLGFGDNFFDTTPYDTYPSEETRYILRALNEQIYTNELLIYRNRSLTLLFEYIQSETIENQNYLPWLNKTSLIDVGHTIRELRPIEVFQSDNQDFLSGYINEVKPYHVVIKDFLFKYTGIDVFEGDITDFDLPAQYDNTIKQFVTPELVYANPSAANQYLPTDPIWETLSYNQWFTNFGLGITGVDNYQITTLASYIALNSNEFYVDNAFGFPINGVVKLFDYTDPNTDLNQKRYELIAYSGVDRANNLIYGLTRGVDGTPIVNHLPGSNLYINLPAVLLLDGGRGYTEPPKVVAYYDEAIYGPPKRAAQLEAVMYLDSVLSVNVIDPGAGYPVLPEIRIDPSISISFSYTNVSTLTNTISLSTPLLQTGDLIKYVSEINTEPVGGLEDNQYYYVNVLETAPTFVIALYTNYRNSILDQDRVVLFGQGTGTNNKLNLSARASCVSTSLPIRQNNITLKFDRTSYTSQVTDWRSGSFYGSFYAGLYNNSESIASSSISLQDTQPPIDSILASAQGAPFEINSVTNEVDLTWSSRTRDVVATIGGASDIVTIIESEGGTTTGLPGIGPTIGFYVNMPVKFVGAVGSTNIVNDTTYYVHTILNDTQIKISATEGGSVFNLNSETIGSAGLKLYVGQVVDTTILNIDYPGIRQATITTANTNKITVPLSLSGLGGTQSFYTNLPIFFTGSVFGGVIENETYYVTTVADNQNFTMSTLQDPVMVNITATADSSDPFFANCITCSSTLGLTINDPVIFTDLNVTAGTCNIIQGQVYYVSSLFSGTKFIVSEVINGGEFDPGTSTISGIVTDQKDTVTLSSATGSMTLNVGLPISPGQINGQQFTLYPTSGQYTGISGTNGNLITRTLVHALISGDYLMLDPYEAGLTNMYVGMPIELDGAYAGLASSTTYTITALGTITSSVTNTSSSGNLLTCASTAGFYVDMPITFSGTSLGGVELDYQYYIKTIPSGLTFTISDTPGGTTFTLTNDNGTMTVTGVPYIRLDTAVSVDETTEETLVQNPTTDAVVDVSNILGGYRVIITNGGVGYAMDNTITISGALIGGATPLNDLTLTVNSLDTPTGDVTSFICTGTPAGTNNQYYFKVTGANTVEVYSDPLMRIPVAYDDFPYSGIRSTAVTATTTGTNLITVTSTANFNINDPVVFTGETIGGLVVGQTYYILSIPSLTTLTVSETVGGTTFNLTTDSGSCFMAKSGDFALLPEPFYFNQSIVKYNNRVYQCIVSNNDTEFIFGKWELLNSGDRELNALDRIVGYYQPTINMPGLDLSQLVSGITYPNPTYLGNAFAPDDEFTLDTILQDRPFYPTEIDTTSIVWNGVSYIAGANTPTYSAIIYSIDGNDWTIDDISNQPVAIKDMLFANGQYVMVTNNSATPVYISPDGITWTTNGSYTPYGIPPYSSVPYDITGVYVQSTSLNSLTYNNGTWLAVGENIVKSSDTYVWLEVYGWSSSLYKSFNGITYVDIPNFQGFITVGGRQISSGGIVSDINILLTSLDNGVTWTDPAPILTSNYLNGIISSSTLIVIVGDNSTIFTSINGSTYTAASNVGTGSDDLLDVTYGNSIFVAVGENGCIKTSADGDIWTKRTSNTTEHLNAVIYNSDNNEFIVVGDNNIILKSTNGTTWTSSNVFSQDETVYDVQGETFLSGYGPEELVPGVVTDNLTMIVSTRPGTNWNVTIYQHVGYNVVSTEITPTTGTQTIFSFANLVQTPAQIAVWAIDPSTGLGTRLYDVHDFILSDDVFDIVTQSELPIITQNYQGLITENSNPASSFADLGWVTQTLQLLEPLPNTNWKLRIDVYEVGNGDQLVKSNSQSDPIRINNITGFNEIYLDCNYSATRTAGGGVIRPGTQPIQVLASETFASEDTIQCDDVSNFVLNGQISFQGSVFGGVTIETPYFVKTISTVTKRITISSSLISGVAGPTLALTDGVGSMNVIIQVGSGLIWSDPIMYHNGVKLIYGSSLQISQTNSIGNSITCNSTGGLVVGDAIKFSSTMFGNVTPHQLYYVESIVDGNEFTISETYGGAPVTMINANGGALAITNDYTIGLVDNSITAKLIFSRGDYNQDVDYFSYTVFGETEPAQYGYTIPETETFLLTESQTIFQLQNYVGGSNEDNAVVEYNGLRLVNVSDYTINTSTNILTLNFATTAGDTVAITTYNDTQRQYFHTNYGGSFSGAITTTLTITDTTHEPGYDAIVDAGEFVIGNDYVIDTIGTTDFTLIGAASNTVGLLFTATGAGSGTGTASVGYDDDDYSPGPDFLTTTGSTSVLNLNAAITFSSPTLGGLIAGQTYYIAEIISATTFSVSETPGGTPVTLYTDSGTMSGLLNPPVVANIVLIDNAISAPIATTLITATSSTGNIITASSTTGFITGQTVEFKTASTTIGNLNVTGQIYWVSNIVNGTDFTICENQADVGNVSAEFDPGTDTGAIVAYVGGVPAVRITTGIEHNLEENNVVRIDGTTGSTELNNNTYYAKIIDDYTIDLYNSAYDPAYGAVNDPVTSVSTWTGGGYVWLDKSFTLVTTVARSTSSAFNTITVDSTSELVLGTPVIFTGNVFGNVVDGTTYYVKEVTSSTQFKISATRDGETFILSNASGTMAVTQWEQVNVDRIWVTINGYRVPSSKLVINPDNNLSILSTIQPGDIIIITSMIPTATPNQEIYLDNVNKYSIQTVYRANPETRTWLVSDLYNTDETIYVNDVNRITNTIISETTCPSQESDGSYHIGLTADKRIICQVIVYNDTTGTYLNDTEYSVIIENIAPILKITSGVTTGDNLIISVIEGNVIYVNGEQIRFSQVDFALNTLSGIQRGSNGTGEQAFIAKYSEVYGILSENLLPSIDLTTSWNSFIYNPTEGDPLQISNTSSANFLKADVS